RGELVPESRAYRDFRVPVRLGWNRNLITKRRRDYGLGMANLVTYELNESVATITMDDGKGNVLTPQIQADINDTLDQPGADNAVVVLTGRPGVFSAGFDLAVLRAGGPEGVGMLMGGFELAERLLSFPTPVVIACSGHAIAMGVFTVLSADYRI